MISQACSFEEQISVPWYDRTLSHLMSCDGMQGHRCVVHRQAYGVVTRVVPIHMVSIPQDCPKGRKHNDG